MTKTTGSPGSLQREIFRAQGLLIFGLTLFLAATGFYVNASAESKKRDQNLLNVAETAACSTLVVDINSRKQLIETFDTLQYALNNIDVISIVNTNGIRRYHTNHALIGAAYDGTLPDFSHGRSYAIDGTGPSGNQRRAFAAIYDARGQIQGFVMVIVLRKNIRRELLRALLTFVLIAIAALAIEIFVSYKISQRVKERLLGFEPDSISAMFRVRDSVLESLEEGVVACDAEGKIQYVNRSAARALGCKPDAFPSDLGTKLLGKTLQTGERENNVPEDAKPGSSILIDRFPIRRGDEIVGAVAVLHDKTECVKLAEDLSGTRFLVDSMRANNHDFTNKLHVILGLIEMKDYDRAAEYVSKIKFMQREGISKITRSIDDPSIAALIVGKMSKASELGIKFTLQEGSRYRRSDLAISSAALVTIIGNLIDNALDAMNSQNGQGEEKELLFGVHSQPNALLITVDDSGPGIAQEYLERIFERGFTTKGDGHGFGLYQCKKLVESLGGSISVESTEGVGTSFAVSFRKRSPENV